MKLSDAMANLATAATGKNTWEVLATGTNNNKPALQVKNSLGVIKVFDYEWLQGLITDGSVTEHPNGSFEFKKNSATNDFQAF